MTISVPINFEMLNFSIYPIENHACFKCVMSFLITSDHNIQIHTKINQDDLMRTNLIEINVPFHHCVGMWLWFRVTDPNQYYLKLYLIIQWHSQNIKW